MQADQNRSANGRCTFAKARMLTSSEQVESVEYAKVSDTCHIAGAFSTPTTKCLAFAKHTSS